MPAAVPSAGFVDKSPNDVDVIAAQPEECDQYDRMASSFLNLCKRASRGLEYILRTKMAATPTGTKLSVIPDGQQPAWMSPGVSLQVHQSYGYKWLLASRFAGSNCILADDMGLGKTIQVVGYMAQLLEWYVEDAVAPSAQSSPTVDAQGRLGYSRVEACKQLYQWREAEYKASLTDRCNDSPVLGDLLDATIATADVVDVSIGADRSATRQLFSTPAAAEAAEAAAGGGRKRGRTEAGMVESSSGDGSTLPLSTAAERLLQRQREVAERLKGGVSPSTAGCVLLRPDAFPPLVEPSSVNREQRGSAGPHLIICPSSVMSNWQAELGRFCPYLNVALYRPTGGKKDAEREQKRLLKTANVVIANYTMFERGPSSSSSSKGGQHDVITSRDWDTLVLDEAHDMKNAASTRFANISQLHARHRIMLTGTPVQNNLHELVSLLRFIASDSFYPVTDARGDHFKYQAVDMEGGGDKDWGKGGGSGSGKGRDEGDDGSGDAGEDLVHRRFVEAIEGQVKAMVRQTKARKGKAVGTGASSSSSSDVPNNSTSTESPATPLHDLMSLFVLRRTKDSINLNLPPKVRHDAWLQPSTTQDMILNTLHYAALSQLGQESTLSQAIVAAISDRQRRGGDAAASMSVPSSSPGVASGADANGVLASLSGTNMAFVGQLGAAFIQDVDAAPSTAGNVICSSNTKGGKANAHGAAVGGAAAVPTEDVTPAVTSSSLAEVEQRSGFAGRVMSLLRKAAIHPLLVRARYSNETCLEIARMVQDAVNGSGSSSTSTKRSKKDGDLPSSSSPAALSKPAMVQLSLASSASSSSSSGLLSSIISQHGMPSHADLLQWAGGNKLLAKQAVAILGESDFDIHCRIQSSGLPAAMIAKLSLPAEAFSDSAKVQLLLKLLKDNKVRDCCLV